MNSRSCKRKVLFVIPKLSRGGAERVFLTLLEKLDSKKFELHLVLLARSGKWRHKIPRQVNVHDLNAGRVRKGLFHLLLLIFKLKPDATFSTVKEANLATCLVKALFFRRMYLVIRETNTLSLHVRDSIGNPKLWYWLYRLFYPRANKIICLSQYVMNDLIECFRTPPEKLVSIYNPVDVKKIMRIAAISNNPFTGTGAGPNIVAAGRFVNQKGFDRLIKAFPRLRQLKAGAQLWILGTGPLESQFKELRDSQDLRHCIHFPGFQEDIFAWLKHADLFVLSSRYEGLSNVLLEAMVCGCPVAATDHPGGTREVMELTNQIERLSPDLNWKKEWFKRDSADRINRIRKHFDISVVVHQYTEILNGQF